MSHWDLQGETSNVAARNRLGVIQHDFKENRPHQTVILFFKVAAFPVQGNVISVLDFCQVFKLHEVLIKEVVAQGPGLTTPGS